MLKQTEILSVNNYNNSKMKKKILVFIAISAFCFNVSSEGKFISDISMINEADTDPPVIKLIGAQDTTVIVGSTYADPGAVVTDDIDDALSADIDASNVNTAVEGRYFVKIDAADHSGNQAKTVYRVVNVRSPEIVIGPRKVFSTPVEMGTVFVAPEPLGSGDGSSPDNAYGWEYFHKNVSDNVKPGDIIFFKGGNYILDPDNPNLDTFVGGNGLTYIRFRLRGGTKEYPVTYESYPGDTAVFTCPDTFGGTDRVQIQVRESEEYMRLRKVEIKGFPSFGMYVFGNHCIVEGCNIHHNGLSGVEQINRINAKTLNDFSASYNIYRDNLFHHNSDVGYSSGNFANGGNADGIVIHQGMYNTVEHNDTYYNSDDGIDGWRSFGTKFLYNKCHHNGSKYTGGTGDGSGLKMGGYPSSTYPDPAFGQFHVGKHNLLYSNSAQGEKENACRYSVLMYNTSYNNSNVGYTLSSTVTPNISLTAVRNIAYKNSGDYTGTSPIYQAENTWNLGHTVTDADFISLDETSPDYLRPTSSSVIAGLGAYADEENLDDITPPVVGPVGDMEINIDQGNAYVEQGGRAYDDHDGWISDITIDNGGLDTSVPGDYTITYSATDKAGNTGSCIRIVHVIAVTGIDENNVNLMLAAYPNPTNGIINIRIDNKESANEIILKVFNSEGKLVLSDKYSAGIGGEIRQIDMTGFENGTYFIQVITGGHSLIRKVILNK